MLAKLEKLQNQQHEAMNEINEEKCPKKYRNQAKKDYEKLHKDLDKIYAMYARIAMEEERVCKKWGI